MDWTRSAAQAHDHVRGMTPWPGAHTWVDGKRFKLVRTAVCEPEGEHGPSGTILTIDRRGAEIACGRGTLRLLEGQLEGRKCCSADQLASGRCIAVGQRLGAADADG